MRIETLSRVGSYTVAALLVAALALSGMMAQLQQTAVQTEARRHRSYQLAEELRQSSEDLTRLAQAYVSTRNPRYLHYYDELLGIRNGTLPRPADYSTRYWDMRVAGLTAPPSGPRVSLRELMRREGFSDGEFELLSEAERRSDALVSQERQAFAVVGKDPARAHAILYGKAYERQKAQIMEPIDRFIRMVDERTQRELVQLDRRQGAYMDALLFLLGSMFLGFLLLSAYLRKQLLTPLSDLERHVREITSSKQPGDLEPRGFDELVTLGNGVNEMSRAVTREIEALKALDALKNSFVNAISHDLRTPITSLRGYAEFLADGIGGTLTAEQQGFVAQIEKASLRLMHLVDDLLDFARLEAGTLRLNLTQTDLAEKINEVVESLRPQVQEAGINLSVELAPDPLVMLMDPERIERVLINLLTNAIKFTPPGRAIRVRTRREDGEVVCEVIDEGIGIAPEAIPRLFKHFSQLEGGVRKGGTGLGLSISKALVEAHGGRIGVRSTPGQGSTFWFTLPLGEQPPA
ncbi:HAMP domain-containing histidine kinase [bacterium]|nr:HAMP domain-containing histidine kinase [bacterium]